MSLIHSNIRFLRKQKVLTQEIFANEISVTRSVIGAYEEGRAEPKIKTMQIMADFFGVSMDQLLNEDLSANSMANLRGRERESTESQRGDITGKRMRVLSITVDKHDRENIELVPAKAAAGYLNGYADPEFIAELPHFQLPNMQQGTYRAFELKGDSMLPLPSGSIVVGEYVENWEGIKDGHCYIVVTLNEGVVYKRVYNRIDESKSLRLVSDNTAYSPYEVNIQDVVEVWKAKSFISSNFPEPELSMQKLASIVMDLQKEVIKLKG
jgi:transcriptional regulator with XRE-family HTH domain